MRDKTDNYKIVFWDSIETTFGYLDGKINFRLECKNKKPIMLIKNIYQYAFYRKCDEIDYQYGSSYLYDLIYKEY